MQIDATTFLLELVNFAVLVWILHRFLYRPVRAAIERRRAGIEETLAQAQASREEAERLKAAYEGRFEGWETERAAARTRLAEEIAALRARGQEEAERAATEARKRGEALEARHAAQRRHETESQALALAGRFATRLLGRLAGPELDVRLAEVLAEDLAAWPPERTAPLVDAAREHAGQVRIDSAHALPRAVQERLVAALEARLGLACRAEYRVDERLIAGVRVAVGPWTLQSSLADELQFFTRDAVHAA